MSSSGFLKALYMRIIELKQCSKNDAPVRFLLDKSPFSDEEDEDAIDAAVQANEFIILGRILPESEIYKEGAYQIEMKLTKLYPYEPPKVRFITPIYHPNVDKDGKFRHELLTNTEQWSVRMSLVDVVKAITDRIDHPDIEGNRGDPEIVIEYKENRPEFNRKALATVKKHAVPRN